MPTRTRLLWPLLALVGFLALLATVPAGWEPLTRFDRSVSDWFRGYGADHPDLISFTRLATDVMSTVSFVAVGIAATVLFAARRQAGAARFCAAVTVTVPLLWGVLHALLHRPRPTDGFVDIDSNGFPSGHTSHAAATAVAAVLLCWPTSTARRRWTVVVVAACFAGAIGLTRLVLLAHWPVDVVGGWLLALAVVPLLAIPFSPARPAPGPGSRPVPDRAGRASPGSG